MNMQTPIRYESRAAIDRLIQMLDLNYMDYMQDWDIELADAARVAEFCDLYETAELDADEKFALMRLIIASLDNLLHEDVVQQGINAKRVEYLLHRDFTLHFYTLEYWCCHEEIDPENVFTVTPLLREVWLKCFQPECELLFG